MIEVSIEHSHRLVVSSCVIIRISLFVALSWIMCSFALSLLAVLAAFATLSFAAPPYPCKYTSPTNDTYDLSNMYRDPSKGQQDYSAPSGADMFYVNVCGEAQETQCNPLNGVCQVTPSASYGNGDASQATWDALRMCATTA
jgi:hypothetical protein